jgi:hypothetical protein
MTTKPQPFSLGEVLEAHKPTKKPKWYEADAMRAYLALLHDDGDADAMAALVRYLRSDEPIDPQFRRTLANLFEGEVNRRKLVFKRRPGRQPDPAREMSIATHIQIIMRKLSKEQAIADAMKRFNLGRKRVTAIWEKWRLEI